MAQFNTISRGIVIIRDIYHFRGLIFRRCVPRWKIYANLNNSCEKIHPHSYTNAHRRAHIYTYILNIFFYMNFNISFIYIPVYIFAWELTLLTQSVFYFCISERRIKNLSRGGRFVRSIGARVSFPLIYNNIHFIYFSSTISRDLYSSILYSSFFKSPHSLVRMNMANGSISLASDYRSLKRVLFSFTKHRN